MLDFSNNLVKAFVATTGFLVFRFFAMNGGLSHRRWFGGTGGVQYQGMYLNYDSYFENGDMIEVVGPYPRHVGVYASGRGVIHNAKGGFVQITDVATFSGGKPVRAIRRVAGTWFDKEAAVNRAISLQGKPYDLLKFNCEHAAYYALTGKPSSPQLGLAVAGLALFGLLLFAWE